MRSHGIPLVALYMLIFKVKKIRVAHALVFTLFFLALLNFWRMECGAASDALV